MIPSRTSPKIRASKRGCLSKAAREVRFASIYDVNYHCILGYALRRTRPDDAADVVAETFTIAWRRIDDIPDGGEARLWLYGVARRVLANHKRAERRRERLAAMVGTPVPETGFDSYDVEPNLAATAFARLRAEERELLALFAWEQLDAAAIGRVLGCSRNAVRIRLHRARRRFARELAAFGVPARPTRQTGQVRSVSPPPRELEDSL